MRGRIQIQMPSIRRVPWGFFEPDVTIVDAMGLVSVRPANTDGYPEGTLIRANGFDGHRFAALATVHEKMEYLHSAGFDVVPVKEGYVIAYPDEGPSVEGEDRLRLLYHRWQSRKALMPSDSPRGCPFRLCHDAKVASAIVESESERYHIGIAMEYVACRDSTDGISSYSTEDMHGTILSIRTIADASDPQDMAPLADEIENMAESYEREYEYVVDLADRMRCLNPY